MKDLKTQKNKYRNSESNVKKNPGAAFHKGRAAISDKNRDIVGKEGDRDAMHYFEGDRDAHLLSADWAGLAGMKNPVSGKGIGSGLIIILASIFGIKYLSENGYIGESQQVDYGPDGETQPLFSDDITTKYWEQWDEINRDW